MVFAGLELHSRHAQSHAVLGTNWFLPSVFNNANSAAYVAAAFHSEQNALSHRTLEWKAASRPVFQGASFLLAGTNALLH